MRRLIALAATLALAAAVLRRVRRPAGRTEVEGVLIADAPAYDRLTGRLLGSFYAGIAADVAAVAPPGARALDVGSGPGHLASLLADRGLDVVAIDLDPAMVARAGDRLAGRGQAAVASVTKLPFPDASFDVVASTLSMHHWADPVAGLTEIARVLRPTGRALIWDIAGRWIPLHGDLRDPARHVAASSLELVTADAWRWPGPLALTRRLELRRAQPKGEG